ncbi:MAG: oligosaccharide flippase family protein [Solirubrobacteraceae bacterium]
MQDAGKESDGDFAHDAPPLRGIAVRGARLALLGWGASQGLTFVAYIVLARLATPADFGQFAAAMVLVGVGNLLGESGMMAALINRRDRIDEAASTAFFSLAAGGLLLTLGALALAPLVGLYYHSSRVGVLSAALAASVLIRMLTIVPDSLLQRRMSFARRVAVDPLGSIAFAAVAIAACAGGAGAWGLVAGMYASLVVQVIFAWVFARKRPRWREASMEMWRELSSFGRPVLGSEILRFVASQLDAVTLGRLAGTAALGQYRNGLRLAQQPANAFVDVGAYVLLPLLARMSGQPDRLTGAVKRVFGVTAAAALPVSVAMIPLGVPIAVLSLGQRWRPAGHVIAGLSFMLIGIASSSVAVEAIKAIGRPQLLVRMSSVYLTLTAVCVTAGAVWLGSIGVAIGVSLSACLSAVFNLAVLTGQLELSRRELLSVCAGPAVASAVMLVVMLLFSAAIDPASRSELAGIGATLAEAAIGLLAYLAVLVTVDRPRREDLRSLAGRLPGFATR